MPGLRTLFLILFVGCALSSPLRSQTPVGRVYVEPFTVRTGAEALRTELVAELRKLKSVSLVDSQSNADAILAGGGDVWVKGYRSLNPRSGRSVANGTPMYTGFLSVELTNQKGETLWSYLATPGATAEDVSKDLAKRIARHVADAIAKPEAMPAADASNHARLKLYGSGATFPYPVYTKWFTNYRRVNPNLEIAYDSIGSQAGVRKLIASEADFGASDSPEAIRELAPAEESKYLFLPSVAGAVVPIVNLPGFSGEIAFTPEALAGIYLGKIKKWNDPILKAANRGVHLPDLDIVVVHRSDGSGTSYAFTDFLSRTNPEWKTQVGSGLGPKWPLGKAAAGNDGVAKLVKELGGAIGYVEFIYALRNRLTFGKVKNQNGEFVAASLESIALAARHSADSGDGLKKSIVDSAAPGAYPISSFTWIVIPAHIADDAKRAAMKGFLQWMLGPGQRQAAALGYVSLPKDVVALEEAAIGRMN